MQYAEVAVNFCDLLIQRSILQQTIYEAYVFLFRLATLMWFQGNYLIKMFPIESVLRRNPL